MNFQEAEAARRNLDTKKQNGKLSEEEYCAEINKIRVTDAKNCWWQPDSRGPGWLCWNGKEWVAGEPPGPGTVAGLAPAPGAAGKTAPQKPAKPVEYTFRPVSDDEPGYKLMSLAQFIVIAKTVYWRSRPRKWWDLFSILFGTALAILWLIYSSLNPRSEGWDLLTPVLMIAVPVVLVSFRKPIDELLMPLQPHRAKLPHLLLLGLGLCVPFLIAFLLYNLFHVKEYSLIRATMVIGTFVAYAVTRDPVLAAGFKRTPRSLKGPVAVLLLFTFVIGIVRGDDCASDPLNASDCLRTSGYSETMAGGASAAEAGANAAGDEAIDPKHTKDYQDWLDSLERNTWYKDGDLWVKVDDNGVARYTNKDPGATGDGTTGSDTGTTGNTDTPPATGPQPTGTSVKENLDGSKTTTTTWSDGTTSTSTRSADGTVTTVDRTGVSQTTTPGKDGSTTTTTTYPDGSKSTSTRSPDGTTVTKNSDGSVTTKTPDGTETTEVTNIDGSKTVTYPDGTTVTTDPDGTVTTTTTWPDGTRTTTTQNPDGTTDVSERGGPESPDEGSGEPGGTGESGDGGEIGGFGGEEK